MSSEGRFVWASDCRVGIKALDEQYKGLVALAHGMIEPLAMNDRGRVTAALEILIGSTRMCFAVEEAVMQTIGDGSCPRHAAAHGVILKKLRAFADAYKAGDDLIDADLLMLLKVWLFDHIRTTDKRCFRRPEEGFQRRS